MSDVKDFPYDTHLDIKYEPLELIDLPAVAAKVTHPWFNQTLCQVNGSVVRVGIVKGEYHWHKHDDDDEFFFTLEGELLIDIREANGAERTVSLRPQQGITIPKGVVHRTRAEVRTVMLMVENVGIIPTGDE